MRNDQALGVEGFSLIEALVALSILLVGILSVAQLFPLASAANVTARHSTQAAILAAQKAEELRALMWGFDEHGAPVTDPLLLLAHASDVVDGTGNLVAAGATRSATATYSRRWSINPLPSDPINSVVITVRVELRGNDIDDGPSAPRRPGEVRLAMARTRKAP